MLSKRLPVLMLSLLAGTAAQAAVLDLTTMMGNANAYTLHNFSAPSSDVEGALLSGGSVSIASYSVNYKDKDAFGSYALVARNNLTLNGGSIDNGKIYVGGTTKLTNAAAPPTGAKPVDFDAAASYYKAVSTNLSQAKATGTVTPLWSGVVLTGKNKGNNPVDVFNVDASVFAHSSSWTLQNLTPGQTLIFNVGGSSATFNNGGISFEPLSGYNVLFNFYDATNVDVRGVIGSVLAPKAAVTTQWGVINGNVIVDSWSSTIQINANHYFKPINVPTYSSPMSVPEPENYAMLLAGLALVAFAARRR